MKKKNGTSAGIPRPSGERSSPVGNGNANREVCTVKPALLNYPPSCFRSFVVSCTTPRERGGCKLCVPSMLYAFCLVPLILVVVSVSASPRHAKKSPSPLLHKGFYWRAAGSLSLLFFPTPKL